MSAVIAKSVLVSNPCGGDEIFRTRPDRTWDSFLGSKAAGAWRWPSTPSNAEVNEREDPYLDSLYGLSWPLLGWTLCLHVFTCILPEDGPCESQYAALTFWHRNYFFLILAHTVYKMWIIQEQNTLELWNKLHFEEKKKRTVYTTFKISVPIFVE